MNALLSTKRQKSDFLQTNGLFFYMVLNVQIANCITFMYNYPGLAQLSKPAFTHNLTFTSNFIMFIWLYNYSLLRLYLSPITNHVTGIN